MSGKFLDPKAEEQRRKERQAERRERQRKEDQRRAWSWLGLVAADTALVAMVILELVHPVIGMGALAAVSAWLGRGTA